ncbi:MAG: mannose-1-phosphate guanylyltransferase [Alphaproteobacteria bacterium]|nr:mannose-1-phosphate guanylyltransferase [Alphaproteobacteria bacterium]
MGNLGPSGVVPVVLCGGSGTRLWPSSREKLPKQFLKLLGGSSLLQETITRALRISGANPENVVTVTLGKMSESVRKQLHDLDPALAVHVLSEPSARDTGAAVAYAANYVRENFGGEAVMWILPSDHHIADEQAMKSSLENALWAAGQGHLVTFGIQPTRPETGYGYILEGNALKDGAVYNAEKFVEKPDLETAKQYLASGKYLWNSGMFVFNVDSVLGQYEKHAKSLNDTVKQAMAKQDGGVIDAELYASIEKKPFDKAIMEVADHVAVVPANPDWSDIGSWESLWEIRAKDENGNVKDGDVFCLQSTDCMVQANGKLVACAGVRDLVVIDTPDSLLVADKKNSDIMKHLVNALKADSRPEVTEIGSGPGIEEISIDGKGAVGLGRAGQGQAFVLPLEGHVTIVDGNGKEKPLRIGEAFFMAPDAEYRLENREGGKAQAVKVTTSFANDIKSVAAE